ncbi:MAG: 4-hydroxybenzoate octaprenyltransferase [Planctomycetota bacterium]
MMSETTPQTSSGSTPPTTTQPERTHSVHLGTKAAALAADIKLAHSVFALPFALLGALLAAAPTVPESSIAWPTLAGQLALAAVCMVAARTWAMVVNRLADRRFDAHNPRTAKRAFAAGTLSPKDGYAVLVISAAVFLAASAAYWPLYDNPWPLVGAPTILAWLAFYSFTKRFTAACHLVLGSALALSPIAAAIAVGGLDAVGSHQNAPAIWALAAMVTLWVAGFDVIYALADRAFDRENGLRSLPAALGWTNAARTSAAMHALASVALILAWTQSPTLGPAFGIAAALTVGLLIAEHAVLAVRRERGLHTAFFTINGVVALVLGAAGAADLLLGP